MNKTLNHNLFSDFLYRWLTMLSTVGRTLFVSRKRLNNTRQGKNKMNVTTKINREQIAQVAAESIKKINPKQKDGQRWINAIAKAVIELESNPYCDFDEATHSLLICSSQSGETYRANGTCQCKAFEQGTPCFHRAAARIVAICVERERNKVAVTKKGNATIYATANGQTIKMYGL